MQHDRNREGLPRRASTHQVGEAKLVNGRRLARAAAFAGRCRRARARSITGAALPHGPWALLPLMVPMQRRQLLLLLAWLRRRRLLRCSPCCARHARSALAAATHRATHAAAPRPLAAARGGAALLGGRAGGGRRGAGAEAQVRGVLLAHGKAEALHAQPIGASLQGKRRVPT